MTDNEFDLEEMAAFIDGRLTGEVRSRVVRQLARSEATLAVYAEAVRLHAERVGREVVPVPVWRRPWIYVAPPLAAAAAAALLMVLPLRSSAPPSAASLVTAMGDFASIAAALAPEWDQRPWSVTRGGPARLGEPELAFRLGVRTVDLQVSLGAMDTTLAKSIVAEMKGLLQQTSMSQAVVSSYTRLETRLGGRDVAPGVDLQRLAGAAESLLGEFLPTPRFSFGRWCAAAELAARTRLGGFFQSDESRSVIEDLDDLDLDEVGGELFRHITAIIDRGVDDDGYDELQGLLADLIRHLAG